MADAARVCEDLGFDILDINFGCPVNKVVKCNGGSGLLARPWPWWSAFCDRSAAAISIPFTMKFRAGWSDQELVAVQMAQLAEECGLQAVALHPRTREQGYSGRADWTRIAEVKSRGQDSGHRQRRYQYAGGRGPHGSGDRLRCRDDRPRRLFQSLDFPADSAVSGDRPIRSAHRPGPLRNDANLLRHAGQPAGGRYGRQDETVRYLLHAWCDARCTVRAHKSITLTRLPRFSTWSTGFSRASLALRWFLEAGSVKLAS